MKKQRLTASMMKIILMISICLLSFPAFAEERQDIYDYYRELQDANPKYDDYDEEESIVDRYYEDPFDTKRDKDSPFYTKSTPREDRVKRQRNFKPIELDNGQSRKKRSSEEVLQWQMQPYKR